MMLTYLDGEERVDAAGTQLLLGLVRDGEVVQLVRRLGTLLRIQNKGRKREAEREAQAANLRPTHPPNHDRAKRAW